MNKADFVSAVSDAAGMSKVDGAKAALKQVETSKRKLESDIQSLQQKISKYRQGSRIAGQIGEVLRDLDKTDPMSTRKQENVMTEIDQIERIALSLKGLTDLLQGNAPDGSACEIDLGQTCGIVHDVVTARRLLDRKRADRTEPDDVALEVGGHRLQGTDGG